MLLMIDILVAIVPIRKAGLVRTHRSCGGIVLLRLLETLLLRSDLVGLERGLVSGG
jgi:hypothetical protein